MSVRTVAVADLEQWTLAGAHWRVLRSTGEHAEIELCACTGEPVERVQAADPATLRYLARAREEQAEQSGDGAGAA